MIAWFLDTRLGRFLAAVAGVVATVLFFYWKGRLEGASAAKSALQKKDQSHADHLAKAADAARIATAADHRPVDQRLHDLNALRD